MKSAKCAMQCPIYTHYGKFTWQVAEGVCVCKVGVCVKGVCVKGGMCVCGVKVEVWGKTVITMSKTATCCREEARPTRWLKILEGGEGPEEVERFAHAILLRLPAQAVRWGVGVCRWGRREKPTTTTSSALHPLVLQAERRER